MVRSILIEGGARYTTAVVLVSAEEMVDGHERCGADGSRPRLEIEEGGEG
jgi:hypothetical protein